MDAMFSALVGGIGVLGSHALDYTQSRRRQTLVQALAQQYADQEALPHKWQQVDSYLQSHDRLPSTLGMDHQSAINALSQRNAMPEYPRGLLGWSATQAAACQSFAPSSGRACVQSDGSAPDPARATAEAEVDAWFKEWDCETT